MVIKKACQPLIVRKFSASNAQNAVSPKQSFLLLLIIIISFVVQFFFILFSTEKPITRVCQCNLSLTCRKDLQNHMPIYSKYKNCCRELFKSRISAKKHVIS